MPERLKIEDKVVGLKQVRRGIRNSEVDVVYLAKDADPYIQEIIKNKCSKKEIPIIYIDSKKELGRNCNIDINAAVAALLK